MQPFDSFEKTSFVKISAAQVISFCVKHLAHAPQGCSQSYPQPRWKTAK
jgi:hypothetical protein